MKKFLGNLARIVISFGAIALILYSLRGKLSESWQIIQTGVTWSWFLSATCVYFVSLLLLALRLKWIFKLQKITLTYGRFLYISFVGLFFNFFLPSSVGGDVVKIYYACKATGQKIASSTSVIVDRLMGFAAIMIMGVVAVLISGSGKQQPVVIWILLVFSALLGLIILFFFNKAFAAKFTFLKKLIPSDKIRSTISQTYHSFHEYRQHGPQLLNAVALSCLIQSLFIFCYFLLLHSIRGESSIPLVSFFIIIPITTIISMTPSLGGLGVREAGAIYFFSQYIPQERALALTILMAMITYGAGLLGGVLFAFSKEKDLNQMEDTKNA